MLRTLYNTKYLLFELHFDIFTWKYVKYYWTMSYISDFPSTNRTERANSLLIYYLKHEFPHVMHLRRTIDNNEIIVLLLHQNYQTLQCQWLTSRLAYNRHRRNKCRYEHKSSDLRPSPKSITPQLPFHFIHILSCGKWW